MRRYRDVYLELRCLLYQKNSMLDGSVMILLRLAEATWSGTLTVLSDILLHDMRRF
jgi:hypothetical protein